MNKLLKRTLSILTAIAMMLACLPVLSFADDIPTIGIGGGTSGTLSPERNVEIMVSSDRGGQVQFRLTLADGGATPRVSLGGGVSLNGPDENGTYTFNRHFDAGESLILSLSADRETGYSLSTKMTKEDVVVEEEPEQPKPVEEPAQAEPAEKPVEEPEQAEPAEKPVEEPEQAEPAEKPVEEPEEPEPAKEPAAEPAQAEPAEEPAEEPTQAEAAEEPAEEPAQAEAAEEPSEEPAQAEAAEEPAEEPAQAEAAEEPSEELEQAEAAEEPAEEPAQAEPAEEPSEEPTQAEAAEEPAEEPAQAEAAEEPSEEMLNNGTIVMLSEENDWTETVTELPTMVNGKPAEYFWTEQETFGYMLESVETEGTVTVFTNKPWERPQGQPVGKKPKTYGETLFHIDDYDTPLGVNVIINHVGDCFD